MIYVVIVTISDRHVLPVAPLFYCYTVRCSITWDSCHWPLDLLRLSYKRCILVVIVASLLPISSIGQSIKVWVLRGRFDSDTGFLGLIVNSVGIDTKLEQIFSTFNFVLGILRRIIYCPIWSYKFNRSHGFQEPRICYIIVWSLNNFFHYFLIYLMLLLLVFLHLFLSIFLNEEIKSSCYLRPNDRRLRGG
jgi:hypothetical protein